MKADPRFCELLNDPEHEGPWLVSLTDTLRDALAAATPERLLETATAWTHTEDGGGQDPGLLADFLERLGELARDDACTAACPCGELHIGNKVGGISTASVIRDSTPRDHPEAATASVRSRSTNSTTTPAI
ncbi:hypothetical protein ACFVYE_35580 [Streptomyces sp. NPDC058239]|uniref:hypothetical protein n=1 Tax=Streptomyces sp. NPDC058239 TaxID=3346395 RepID=UPI0036E551A7